MNLNQLLAIVIFTNLLYLRKWSIWYQHECVYRDKWSRTVRYDEKTTNVHTVEDMVSDH